MAIAGKSTGHTQVANMAVPQHSQPRKSSRGAAASSRRLTALSTLQPLLLPVRCVVPCS